VTELSSIFPLIPRGIKVINKTLQWTVLNKLAINRRHKLIWTS